MFRIIAAGVLSLPGILFGLVAFMAQTDPDTAIDNINLWSKKLGIDIPESAANWPVMALLSVVCLFAAAMVVYYRPKKQLGGASGMVRKKPNIAGFTVFRDDRLPPLKAGVQWQDRELIAEDVKVEGSFETAFDVKNAPQSEFRDTAATGVAKSNSIGFLLEGSEDSKFDGATSTDYETGFHVKDSERTTFKDTHAKNTMAIKPTGEASERTVGEKKPGAGKLYSVRLPEGMKKSGRKVEQEGD